MLPYQCYNVSPYFVIFFVRLLQIHSLYLLESCSARGRKLKSIKVLKKVASEYVLNVCTLVGACR